MDSTVETTNNHLLISRDITGTQEPEAALGKGFIPTRHFGEQLLTLRQTIASESDTLLRVQYGGLGYQTFDTPHTTVHLDGEERVGSY